MSATVTSTVPVTVAVDAYITGKHSLGAYDGFVVGEVATNTGIIVRWRSSMRTAISQFLISTRTRRRRTSRSPIPVTREPREDSGVGERHGRPRRLVTIVPVSSLALPP
jgi:hypothetical protein